MQKKKNVFALCVLQWNLSEIIWFGVVCFFALGEEAVTRKKTRKDAFWITNSINHSEH